MIRDPQPPYLSQGLGTLEGLSVAAGEWFLFSKARYQTFDLWYCCRCISG